MHPAGNFSLNQFWPDNVDMRWARLLVEKNRSEGETVWVSLTRKRPNRLFWCFGLNIYQNKNMLWRKWIKLERKLNFIQLGSLLFGREEQHEKFQGFLFSLHFGLAGTNEITGFSGKRDNPVTTQPQWVMSEKSKCFLGLGFLGLTSDYWTRG